MRVSDMFNEDDLMARVNHSAMRKEIHLLRLSPEYKRKINRLALGKSQNEDDGLDVPNFQPRKETTALYGSRDYTHTRKKTTSNSFWKSCEDALRWFALMAFIGVSGAIITSAWVIVAIRCIKLYLYMLWP